MNAIHLTKITSDTPISKRFTLDADGKLVKGKGGNMRSGYAEALQITDLASLKNVIHGLNVTQALTFGVPKGASVGKPLRVLTKGGVKGKPGAIARSRGVFEYPDQQQGILLLDYDPPKTLAEAPDPFELRDMLIKVVPALAQCDMLISASASSFIYKDDGTELNGLRGMHIFVRVANASDIPAIGANIDARCWLSGLGHVETSKSGAKLLRSLIDTTVWQPERLSFDAGADCGSGGLYQHRPDPLHLPGRALMLMDVQVTDDDLKKVINLQRQARGLAELPDFETEKAVARKKATPGAVRLDKPQKPSALDDAKRNELFKALMHIPADCGYELWVKIGMALATVEGGFELWDAWSAKGAGYPGQSELRYKFSTLSGYSVTLGTLFHIAAEFGYTRPVRGRTVSLPVRPMTPDEWQALHESERQKNTVAEVVEVTAAREILRQVMWRWVGAVKDRAKKSGDDNKLDIPAIIEAIEITTGVGKSTLIREFIPIFKQFGLHVVVVAKDKKQAEEYEKAGAFFRRGRECRDKTVIDDKTGESWTLTGFDQGIVNHCPHSKKDGPVGRLAESEHMISEMCRSGHCAHGNQLMLERSEAAGKQASQTVVKFFKDFPSLRHTVHACTWIPHFEQAQSESVRVVVGAGLGTGDLLREAGFSSTQVDGVIVDEAVEWVHTNSLSLDDIRKIIVKLEKLVAAINDHSSKLAKDALKDDGFTVTDMPQKERDAILGALALFKGVVPVLGQATLDAKEGEYISAPVELADLVKDAKTYIGKHGNSWEQSTWERWLTLTASPLRIAFEIVRAAVAGSLTVREGRLNGVYYHPVIEEVAGVIPLLIMDATLDASAKAVITAKGGTVTRIIAKQAVEIRVDPRRFYSLLNPDDKDYEKRLNQEVEEIMTAKKRNEDETGGECGVIARRQVAIQVLSARARISVEEIEEMTSDERWDLSVRHSVGWWGWHDKAHDHWRDLDGLLLWGQPPVPEFVWAEKWEGHRALLIQLGLALPDELPHWDNKWEKKLWIAVNADHQQLSKCRLPANQVVREWMLDCIAALRVQAIGRLRSANRTPDQGSALVYVVGGAPVAGLGQHGLEIAEFERIVGGTTGEERRAARHAARLDDAASAAVAVALKNGSVTRDNVRGEMIENGVCPTTVKDTHAGGTNPDAVRHATYQEMIAENPWMAPWLECNGRNARIVKALQREIAEKGAETTRNLLFKLRVLWETALRDLDAVPALARAVLESTMETSQGYQHAAAVMLEIFDPPG
ncbi:MAG: PriCT-2 domain-containing protein [Acidithiobacillus sp.]|nr:PriCT-2 domain-containing protein [Acidithiobacillus sp.]